MPLPRSPTTIAVSEHTCHQNIGSLAGDTLCGIRLILYLPCWYISLFTMESLKSTISASSRELYKVLTGGFQTNIVQGIRSIFLVCPAITKVRPHPA